MIGIEELPIINLPGRNQNSLVIGDNRIYSGKNFVELKSKHWCDTITYFLLTPSSEYTCVFEGRRLETCSRPPQSGPRAQSGVTHA